MCGCVRGWLHSGGHGKPSFKTGLRHLHRYSEHEAAIELEVLISSLLSSQAHADWKRLNPFVSQDCFSVGMRLITGALANALKPSFIGFILSIIGHSAASHRGLQPTGQWDPPSSGILRRKIQVLCHEQAFALFFDTILGDCWSTRLGSQTPLPALWHLPFACSTVCFQKEQNLFSPFSGSTGNSSHAVGGWLPAVDGLPPDVWRLSWLMTTCWRLPSQNVMGQTRF